MEDLLGVIGGGIIAPEPEGIDPRSADFDDTGLMYADPDRTILATCPFNGGFCKYSCAVMMNDGQRKSFFCAQSVTNTRDEVLVRGLFPAVDDE